LLGVWSQGLDGYPILEMRRVFFCNIEGKKKTCIEDIGYLCMWGEVLHLKPRLHRCCVYFELECRILISSSLWENISDNWREIGCIQNLPCPRQLSWMPELQNFACFGVSISGLHNIVLNMNTCHFRRLFFFSFSCFQIEGLKDESWDKYSSGLKFREMLAMPLSWRRWEKSAVHSELQIDSLLTPWVLSFFSNLPHN
jgi:hypothetical protein